MSNEMNEINKSNENTSSKMTDEECEIFAMEMFIRKVGIHEAAVFMVNQRKSIDGLLENNNSFAKYFKGLVVG